MARDNLNFLEFRQTFRRVEYVRQAKFREIAYRVAEATGLPVFQGRES